MSVFTKFQLTIFILTKESKPKSHIELRLEINIQAIINKWPLYNVQIITDCISSVSWTAMQHLIYADNACTFYLEFLSGHLYLFSTY